ncbi:tRNA (guanosine(37)-N1)-methyltransferase TrmD [Chlamydia pecorum]|uniref:tRNA (guanine-N(1)-)-methyltransferase n=1 Tax=Chlamydia pecorum (strain ATCC VR-628 / DSM 29919 / E58) TaxID=331635 RepID=A0AA34RDW5_CHLPE|nr:tRNA (guanosine(37)-N1)-methyltransferase TrmD [Chlamydia pecorum]AEB41947.1 tRNA (Guanine-N(1)-)-methyltransferase [Chlamydia pecorum E58]UFP06562.1 tRNA (guanosine(37)-N1)-methyltransferase TrmD [Chlamydia pecorum]UJT77284.1 tRNA (Guanine-N(1)-)-methyltransferase [Chlamydia pecorum]
MEIDVLSLFPEYFDSPLQTSILGKAIEKELLVIRNRNLRDFGVGKWKQVDDESFGESGMLLMAQPVVQAIRSVKRKCSRVIYLSPQGALLTAEKSRELAKESHLVLLCGHYEGIDERAIESEVHEEISIGDYVLTNGGLAALVLIDSLCRFIPGVLGNQESAESDSLEKSLLKGPQYTRPRVFEGKKVPEVLLGGNHKEISLWRKRVSLERTRQRRLDLYMRSFYTRSRVPEEREEKYSEREGLERVFIVLEVEKLKRAKTFYSKVFGLKFSDGDSMCLSDFRGTFLWLREVGEQVIPLKTFALQFVNESVFIRILEKWELLGGIIEKQVHASASIVRAQDMDGHTWELSLRKSIE